MKIAVYVEGNTELIFVREFLRKWYCYDSSKVGFSCFELRKSTSYETEYNFGSQESERHYTIVNVGNDSRALSKALDNAPAHRNRDFDLIIVLRDMYSEEYRAYQKQRRVDLELNEKFIKSAAYAIDRKGFEGFVHCRFAIMETEAWLLGIGWFLEKIDPSMTQSFMLEHLDFNLEEDPETCIFHPAKLLKDIFVEIGSGYDKHSHEVNSIMSYLDKGDFEMLIESGHCASFKTFVEILTSE